jgi:hypothetical protein
MAAMTIKEINAVAVFLGAVQVLYDHDIACDPIRLIDSNGDYLGQVKYDTHNGYMFLMPGDEDEEL